MKVQLTASNIGSGKTMCLSFDFIHLLITLQMQNFSKLSVCLFLLAWWTRHNILHCSKRVALLIFL